MLFDYSSGLKEEFNRKGSYMPGTIAKSPYKICESVNSLSTNPPIEFGIVLKRKVTDNGLPYVTTIEEDDSFTEFYGVAVKDVLSQSSVNRNDFQNQLIYTYIAGYPISVLKSGYVAVPVQNGTPIATHQVWVRVAPSTENPSLPIGGIEAEGSVGCVAWKGVFFESDGYYPLKGTNAGTTTNGTTSVCATIFVRDNDNNYGLIPTVEQAPTATDIHYGQPLSAVVLTGGSVSYNETDVEGTFVINNSDAVLGVGEHDVTCTFIPTDTKYERITNIEVTVTVEQTTIEITEAPTASGNLYYGDRLAELDLIGGLATNPYTDEEVYGSFVWHEENTVPSATGNQIVDFVPEDDVNYATVSNINVMVTVVQVPIQIQSQPTASEITSGQTLANSAISGGSVVEIRDATHTVTGSWSWVNGTTVVDETGSYEAKFTPDNTSKYPSDLTTDLIVEVNS